MILGHSIQFFNTVLTTQDVVKDLYDSDPHVAEGVVVVADTQTAGRGQRGRRWSDIPGTGLLMSILLKPTVLTPDQWPIFNMAVALGVQQALLYWCRDVRVKWPNDLFVFNQKLGGILIETRMDQQRMSAAFVGIGINLKATPDHSVTMQPAVSLQHMSRIEVERSAVMQAILSQVELQYLRLRSGKGRDIVSAYNTALVAYPEPVLLTETLSRRNFYGNVLGVDAAGRLEVFDCRANVVKSYAYGVLESIKIG